LINLTVHDGNEISRQLRDSIGVQCIPDVTNKDSVWPETYFTYRHRNTWH